MRDSRTSMALYRFAAIKIRDMVMDGGQARLVKSMDRVIEDIFDFPKLATKISGCHTEMEVAYVFRTFGTDNLVIFRDSRLCDALEDLVHIDRDIRRIRKKLNQCKNEMKEPKKQDIKLERKLASLYQKVIKVICKRLNIREKNTRYYKSSYKAAKSLLKRDDDWDFFKDFGVYDAEGNFYPEDYRDEGVDYFEEYMGHHSTRRASPRRYRDLETSLFDSLADDDDDDDFDVDYFQQYLDSGRESQRREDEAYNRAYRDMLKRNSEPVVPQKSDTDKKLDALVDAVSALVQMQVRTQQPTVKAEPERTIPKRRHSTTHVFASNPGPARKTYPPKETPDSLWVKYMQESGLEVPEDTIQIDRPLTRVYHPEGNHMNQVIVTQEATVEDDEPPLEPVVNPTPDPEPSDISREEIINMVNDARNTEDTTPSEEAKE